MTLDLEQQCICIGGAALAASPAEFSLLRLLITRRNIPMTKDAIMAILYGPAHGRDPRRADFFVARLRKILTPFGLGDAISTIAGRGYAILDEHRDAGLIDCFAPSATPSHMFAAA
ncbi:MAG: winged helix-turn-helix domain-containing protein [Pseudomonadota bacterium]|nr:winged helix-turn-helix domain-containing protein [Pseudomonadota bacterium]